jgi:hypothetical protein
MLERVRKSLVESFIGAIALGWILAEIVLHFVSIFVSPIASWVSRSEFRGFSDQAVRVEPGFLLRDAGPELVRTVLLFVVWSLLLRWLYVSPRKHRHEEPTSEPRTPVS